MNCLGMRALAWGAIVAAMLWPLVSAQAASGAGDELEIGPKVGAAIPHSLAATDQNGAPQDFASLKGTRGLVLLFARSLDW